MSVVASDERCTAFLDIQPVNPGHVLVVPNEHATLLKDLPEADGRDVFAFGQKIAAALYASDLRCEGVDLFLADGEAAGQEVFHVHLHVMPRFRGDGFGLSFGPHYGENPDRDALNATASHLRDAL